MNSLEQDLIRFLIPQGPCADIIAEQIRRASVSSRDYSGAGFFTYFDIPVDAPLIPGRENETERIIFGSVHISSSDLEHGGGAVIFVEKGRIDFLEGYAYGDSWPQRELSDYTLSTPPEKSERVLPASSAKLRD